MLRVVVVCVALLTSGCATEPSAPRTITKVVYLPRPPGPDGQVCEHTFRPMDSAELCSSRKYCTTDKEMTCAEAYYRLTHCANVANTADNHAWLDGGDVRRKDEAPNKRNEPDGLPCEDRCGSSALAMRRAVAAKPFHPPLSSRAEIKYRPMP